MRTANYTDLRANLKSYIDAVIDDYDTVVVNRGNGKGVVMISLDEYNSLKETEYIMSSPDTMEAIHKGEEDIKNGNSISSSPLCIASIVSGDDMMYSVSFRELYSSKEIITTPLPFPRLTTTVS